MKRPLLKLRPSARGFSLLEMLAAIAVLSIILMLVLNIIQNTSRVWKTTSDKMDSFEEARSAFDQITRTLSQADLNIYWGYDDPLAPSRYERSSELQFLSCPMASFSLPEANYPSHGVFFQAPTGKVWDKDKYAGLPYVLNAYGYFIEYGSDDGERPGFLAENIRPLQYRYRIKEWRVPAEEFKLYEHTSGKGTDGKPRRLGYTGADSYSWIDIREPAAHTIAQNVIALVLSPRSSKSDSTGQQLLTEDFVYNSRNVDRNSPQYHQLPPVVDVIMVAVEENSLKQAVGNPSTAPGLVPAGLFQKSAQLEDDLDSLKKSLETRQIRYLVLRSAVRISGAKGTH